MIFVVATLRIKPGTLPDVIAAVKPCIAGTRAEQGCISYDLHQSVTAPETLVFVERWESRAALDAHFKAPHLQAWREAGAAFIVERKVEIIDPKDVETR